MKDDIERLFPLHWYAIAWSRDVKQIPQKYTIANRDFIVYRGEDGRTYAINAYCSHRGADLSLGTCTGNQVLCPYHGWQFGGNGRCTLIPSQPDRPIPAFAHLDAFPTEEAFGLVWVYPGQEKPPILYSYPELTSGKYQLAPYSAIWDAHMTRVIESVLDITHLAHVHRNTIGRKAKRVIEKVDFYAEADAITIHNEKSILDYRFPQQWQMHTTDDEKGGILNYVTFTPIHQNRTLIFGLAGRTFLKSLPFMDTIFSRYSRKVLKEDQAIVESQHPRPIPEALRLEAHVLGDSPQIHFRQRWFRFLTDEEPKLEV